MIVLGRNNSFAYIFNNNVFCRPTPDEILTTQFTSSSVISVTTNDLILLSDPNNESEENEEELVVNQSDVDS
jgi:hypothetical protein